MFMLSKFVVLGFGLLCTAYSLILLCFNDIKCTQDQFQLPAMAAIKNALRKKLVCLYAPSSRFITMSGCQNIKKPLNYMIC